VSGNPPVVPGMPSIREKGSRVYVGPRERIALVTSGAEPMEVGSRTGGADGQDQVNAAGK